MPDYKVLKPVDVTDVPDWERRPPKWRELVDKVLDLKPGQSLPVVFDDLKSAERARNAVRDGANLKARAIVVRTRMVEGKDGKTVLYLTRVTPSQANPPEEK